MDSYHTQAALYKALAHPARLRILDILAHREACVCHLTAVLLKPQPYVSQQLAMLRDAGLIADRREGTLIYYYLADERLAGLIARGRGLLEAATEGPGSFPPVPDGPVDNCPCPHCQAAAGHAPSDLVSPELSCFSAD